MYAVYIIYSPTIDRFYVGFSADVPDRIRRHNSKSKGFTAAGKPWDLVYTEVFQKKSDAAKREKQIKSWKS